MKRRWGLQSHHVNIFRTLSLPIKKPYSRRKVPPYIFTSIGLCSIDVGLPTSSNILPSLTLYQSFNKLEFSKIPVSPHIFICLIINYHKYVICLC